MTTTYFKKSHIKKLTKIESKKNDDGDKNNDVINSDKKEVDTKNISLNNSNDGKVVEEFSMNPFSSDKKSNSNSDDKPKKTEKENDPMSNVFSSSDKSDPTSPTGPTSPTSTTESNTAKSARQQLNSDSFIIFGLHALLCVLLAYIWGFLATNYLYLSTEPKSNLDYILPVEEYKLPYTNDPDSKSWYTYGFPYGLSDRNISKEDPEGSRANIKRRQGITHYLWLSKTGEENNRTGNYGNSFSGALFQYLFAAIYGGLGKGGRGGIRTLLSIISVVTKDEEKDTWSLIKDSFARKAAVFILFPFIALNYLIPGIAIWTSITTYVYGILQDHIWWGLVFTFTIGIIIAMANGVYMGIQGFYVFFLYPWLNNRGETGKWKDIFNSLKTYMLFAFYFLITFYAYEDLGNAGGAGIMVIIAASIIMQWSKDSENKNS